MGLTDRVRDGLRPTNTIAVAPEPFQAPPKASSGAGPAPSSTPAASAAPERPGLAGKRPAYASEPETIAKAYYVEDTGAERRYYDDYKRGALAMRATETSVSSKREDLNTVRAMIDIADARGWRAVEIRGSADFKREAWIEAAARGLEARGYAPTDPERQEAERRRAERGQSTERRAPQTAPSPPTPQPAPTGAKDRADAQRLVDRVFENAVAAENARDRYAHRAEKRFTPKGGSRDDLAGQMERADSRFDASLSAAALNPIADRLLPADRSPRNLAEIARKDLRAPQDRAGPVDDRKALAEAQQALSPDGRTVLEALSEKIDRQMRRLHLEGKAELKAFVAAELLKKERDEGPIVLSADQRRAAAAPEPVQAPSGPDLAPIRRVEPDAPSRSLAR